jgi:CxC1 like cysteine cluster associated with KDZ transposases
MSPKRTDDAPGGRRNDFQGSRKRERSPSASNPHPSSSAPSDTYSSTLEKGLKTFQAVIAKETSSRKVSKKPMTAVYRANPSQLPTPTLSQTNTKPITSAVTAWKFHGDTGTFIATVPINRPAAPRASITKPRYHRKVRISEPSQPSHDTRPSLFSSDGFEDELGSGGDEPSGAPSPMATEQRYVVHYPNYATRLDNFSVENKLSRHARRRSAAARRWDRDVIPALIRPYMEYMHLSQRGQSRTDPPPIECSCNCRGVLKQVTAVYMDRKDSFRSVLDLKFDHFSLGLEYIELRICPCASAPLQLVQRGLFPCSPVYPALAVSLEMLEFVSTLFLHLAPNETAWSDTLATFLARRGHVFEAQDSLRRRFASALGQFQILVRVVNAEVDKQISVARREILSCDPVDRDNIGPDAIVLPKVDESTPITARLYVSALSSDGCLVSEPTTPTMNDHTKGDANGPTMSSRTTLSHLGLDPPISPSDYLRSRCPLCFGGVNKVGESKL